MALFRICISNSSKRDHTQALSSSANMPHNLSSAVVGNSEKQTITTAKIASGSIHRIPASTLIFNLHTTACMVVTVAAAVAVAAATVGTVVVAVVMKALVTETVKAAGEVQQQPKRKQRDQAASNSITAFVRLVPAPICSLASALRLLLRYLQV